MSIISSGKIFISDFFTKGHQRTLQAKKNIAVSFGLKGFSILVSFLLVPLTLNYLNPTKYGIWLTLSSIIGWFGFFDIGLGNGLRNKLAEAFAQKDYKKAEIYVSTTYAILTLIIGIVYLFFLIINNFIDWSAILNTTPELAKELNWIALITFTFFSLRFILKIIGVILTADQLPAYNNIFDFAGNLISLIVIYIISKFSFGSLLYISIAYSAAPALVMIIASFYFFKGKYKSLKPKIKSVDFKYFNSLAGLGFKFFILQLATLVIFTTDNMIITQVLGPAEVTPYNIAFKYFSIPTMIFTIILTPYWSAFTDAYIKKDMVWIKNVIKKLSVIWIFITVGVLFMITIAKQIYLLWIGDKVYIPLTLSILMGVYAILSTWNNIFAFFINGTGKIKLQMYYAVFAMIINIPASIFFAKNMGLGSSGVILGTCTSLIIGTIFSPIQTFKILRSKANGIWNN